MMALPYLPEREIDPMFRRLERDASTAELTDLAQYVERTSIVLVGIHEVNPQEQRRRGLALKTKQTSIRQVAAAILSLSQTPTQRSSINIAPNSPRLREKATEDPKAKVQEGTVETV